MAAGRPNQRESKAREQRFAELLAAGEPVRAAGEAALLNGWRAAELVSDPAFWKRVHSLRKAGESA